MTCKNKNKDKNEDGCISTISLYPVAPWLLLILY